VPTGARVPGAQAPLTVHDGQLSGG
jgi:hypothetical protein